MTTNRLDQIANRQRRNTVLDYFMGALVALVLVFMVTALRNAGGLPVAGKSETSVPSVSEVIGQEGLAIRRCADQPADAVSTADAGADMC